MAVMTENNDLADTSNKEDDKKDEAQPSLVSWLEEKNLTSIKEPLLDAQITLNVLSTLHTSEITQLTQELQLPILQKFKFQNAVSELQMHAINDDNNNTTNIALVYSLRKQRESKRQKEVVQQQIKQELLN